MLTRGCVSLLLQGQRPPSPVLQVTNLKTGTGSRHNAQLSDGSQSIAALLSARVNQLVHEKELQTLSVIRLDEYTVTKQAGKNVVIILTCSVVAKQKPLIGKVTDSTEAFHKEDDQTTSAKRKRSTSSFEEPSKKKQMTSGNGEKSDVVTGQEIPISSLAPFLSSWAIKVRVTRKSEIREWENDRGTGKLFSCNLCDSFGSEIRCTFFKDEVDHYYHMIEVNKCYLISNATVKPANTRFSSLNSEHEIVCNSSTLLQEIREDKKIPKQICTYLDIAQIGFVEKDSIVDVIGVILRLDEIKQFTSKAGKEMTKRTLLLCDQTMNSVEISVWGSDAENFLGSLHSVIGFRKLRVSDFRSISLTTTFDSVIDWAPKSKESIALKRWFKPTMGYNNFRELSINQSTQSDQNSVIFCTVSEAKQTSNELMAISASISMIPHDRAIWYPSCSVCKKKVIQEENEGWFCPKCEKETDCVLRYVFKICIADCTGSLWASAFSEVGEKLFGVTADELSVLKENNIASYHRKFSEICFGKRFVFRARTTDENFRETAKAHTVLSNVELLDPRDECERIASLIEQLTLKME